MIHMIVQRDFFFFGASASSSFSAAILARASNCLSSDLDKVCLNSSISFLCFAICSFIKSCSCSRN